MSVKVNYKGAEIASASTNVTKVLKTSGKYCEDDITIVNTQDGGGGGLPKHGAFFIDYDGEIVEAWDIASIAGKTALPTNPSHTGLVAQGWNWTLANIQAYAAEYPKADIWVGQNYKTASGLTEFDITITPLTGKTVTCNMVGNKTWGDGTSDALTTHTYDDYGDYTITCDGTSLPAGQTSGVGGVFGSTSSNMNAYWCTAVRLGELIGGYGAQSIFSFYYCRNLRTVTVPSHLYDIGRYAFANCTDLVSFTFPRSTTIIRDYIFSSAYSLKNVSMPKTVTLFSSAVYRYTAKLISITYPDNISNAQEYFLSSCTALDRVLFPKSIKTLAANVAYYANYVSEITITGDITSVGTRAFYGCGRVKEYDFTHCTAVPSLANIDAFNGINPNCKILVPAALYSSWIAATNWSTYADYIYPV